MKSNLMAKYFRLNPESHLVKGALRGAVHNLHSGDVYSIDPVSTRVLDACEQGMCLNDIFQSVESISEETIINYLTTLEQSGIGQFYSQSIYIEKLKPGLTKMQRRLMRIPPTLNYIYLELTNQCNLDCVFCQSQSNLVKGTTSCWRWGGMTEDTLLNRDNWIDILKAALQLGCKIVHFIGGEPLLEWETIVELINLTKTETCQIVLTTNGILLELEDTNKIDFLIEHDVFFYLQILSANSQIHDSGVRANGSFEKLLGVIGQLENRGGRYSLTLPVYRNNQYDIDKTVQFLKNLDPQGITIDILRSTKPRSEELAADTLLHKLFRTNPSFPPLTAATFFQRQQGHPFWNGSLAISVTGDVFPCPSARDLVIANIKQKNLHEIYRDEDFGKYWSLGKDLVAVCNQCEYRYACVDNYDTFAKNKLKTKSEYCTYNPLTGRWNNEGKPETAKI